MKTSRMYTILIFTILLFSCNKRPDHCKYSSELINEFIIKTEEKYNLKVIGRGGRYMHQVDGINLAFHLKEPLTIEKSRALIVTLREELLNDINKNKKIRPYLSHYPFTDNGIELSINPTNDDQTPNLDCEVNWVYFSQGSIAYYKKDERYYNTMIKEEKIEDLLSN